MSLPTTITLGDGRTVCLGTLPSDVPPDAGRVPFAAFVAGDAASRLPDRVNYGVKAAAGLRRDYLNKTHNTCVLAALAHLLDVHTANDPDSGGPIAITDQEIADLFASRCTAEGCQSTQIYNAAHRQGLVLGGRVRHTDGYALISPWTRDLVRAGIYALGGLVYNVHLADSWRLAGDGGVWDVPTSTRVVGLHTAYAYGYDEEYVYVSTWGETRKVTWPAFLQNPRGVWADWGTSQVFVILSPSWYGPDGLSPALIDLPGLKAAYESLGDAKMPDLPPLPPPPPPPLGPWDVTTITDPGARLHIPGRKPPNVTLPQIPSTGTAVPPPGFVEWVRMIVREEIAKANGGQS